MLIHSTWTLTVDESMVLPRTYGLELVKLLHERMNLEIGSEAVPTTTYAGLLGHCTASKDFLTFQPGEFYQIQLTGLQEQSSKAIAALDLSDSLEFLGAKFNVRDRHDETSSYEALYHSLVAAEPEPVRRISLQFLTPTAFSQGQTHLPLPVPHSMFRSWLQRWNEFAPVYLGGDELAGYFGEYIALSRHRLQTRSHPIHKGRITGFTGEVTLSILSRADPLLANVANLLCQYAEFAGTGLKTRLGMGRTDYQQSIMPNSRE